MCVWRQGFNLALGEVETSLPREVVTRLKVRFLGVCLTRLKPRFRENLYEVESLFSWDLFGGEVLTSLPKRCVCVFGGKVLTL